MKRLLAMAGLACASISVGALASEAAHEPAADPEYFHRHHMTLFGGGTTRFEEGEHESGEAIGLEYEYRFHRNWGVSLLGEYVLAHHTREFLLVVPVTLHPWRGLKLSAGPGVEFIHHKEEFLFRIAAGYDFHVGRITVGPEVSGDFTRESQAIVYGVALGIPF